MIRCRFQENVLNVRKRSDNLQRFETVECNFFNPFDPKSDQHQFSQYIVKIKVVRIMVMITIASTFCPILSTNSLRKRTEISLESFYGFC